MASKLCKDIEVSTSKQNTPPRPRGRPRGFNRDQALAEALRLFWQRGYEGASIAELTTAMGITPRALYDAFESKEALYREALESYKAGPGNFTTRALQEELTAYAAVARILREAATAFSSADDPTGCMISTAVLACAPEHDPIAATVASMRAATIQALADKIAHGKKKGELPSDVNAQELARFYGAVIQGMSVQARDGADRARLLAIAERSLKAWPR